MDKYGYTIYKNKKEEEKTLNTYYKEDLELMSTYHLREICRKEKLIAGVINPMDKDDLIRVILRFRGKEQNLLIKKYNQRGEVALTKLLKETRLDIYNDKQGQITAKIITYKNLEINVFDNIKIKYDKELIGTNVLVVGGSKICTILNIEQIKDNTDCLYLTKGREMWSSESTMKNYSLYCFEKRYSEMIYKIYTEKYDYVPEHLKVHKIQLLDFEVRELLKIDMPLAIDFGTTNTTAGIYLDNLYFEKLGTVSNSLNLRENNINYVKYVDVTTEGNISAVIPTVAAVLSIEHGKPKYVFGYEAVRLANTSYIDEGFCIFYDIKRWVGNYEKEEEIYDKTGRSIYVKRKEIIKEYLKYVIKEAEHRFKCEINTVHISSPVKQKYLFQTFFQEILPEYTIDKENMLDEGVAVLYNTISEMITKKAIEYYENYDVLIIDCGGGTTDLSSCTFRVEENRVSYKIEIETAYENGDTDFGGNNLTYRIMQILKIDLAKDFEEKEEINKIKEIKEILKGFDTDVFRYIDEYGVAKIYEELDKEYKKAEKIIPTKFKEYENKSRVDYYKVKNNFYFLFETAEKIKKEFFNKIGTLKVMLFAETEEYSDTTKISVDKWKLTVKNKEILETIKDLPTIYFNINDIELLLKSDIYSIINKFMDKMYNENQLGRYSIIKLTGQSCKINIFRDVIKEFVPGKVIQFRHQTGDLTKDLELKLSCIDGAIKYIKDRKYGYADIIINNKMPLLPYVITGYTHTGVEKTLIQCLEKNEYSGNISRNMEDLTLKLYLKDIENTIRYSYTYQCEKNSFRKVVYEEIEKKYKEKIPQDDTDSIEEKEVKFFVWAEHRKWGFTVVPVLRSIEGLMLGLEQFFTFENDNWVQNYFDGTK